MSGDDLRVDTAHLRALAIGQQQAATGIRAATALTDGVDEVVRSTHGVIASATANAMAAVQTARQTAGSKMAEVSDGLNQKLNDAAARYCQVDGAMGGSLDRSRNPGDDVHLADRDAAHFDDVVGVEVTIDGMLVIADRLHLDRFPDLAGYPAEHPAARTAGNRVGAGRARSDRTRRAERVR